MTNLLKSYMLGLQNWACDPRIELRLQFWSAAIGPGFLECIPLIKVLTVEHWLLSKPASVAVKLTGTLVAHVVSLFSENYLIHVYVLVCLNCL